MATRYWYGNAAKVAQVNTLTPTADNSAVYTITINGKSVTYTADASATVAEITAGLVAAFAASEEPEFLELTAEDETTTVTITANSPGVPFTQTSGATGAGALVTATTTDSAGPNDWSIAANWSGATVPVDTDSVVIGPGSVSILYGLSQSGIDLAALTISAGFTGQIGLPDYNGTYREYRTTALTLGTVTSGDIGQGEGTGSPLIRLNVGSNAAALRVWRMGTPAIPGQPALQLQGGHASATLTVYGGTVGLASNPGEAANFPVVAVGFAQSQSSDASLVCGSGCTLGAVTQSGGRIDASSNVTTWVQYAGDATLRGAATLGTLTGDGGTFTDLSSGTFTTVTAGSDFTYDRSKGQGAKTVSNCTASEGARILDPHKTITWSAGVKFSRTGVQSGSRSRGVILDIGDHYTLTPSSF